MDEKTLFRLNDLVTKLNSEKGTNNKITVMKEYQDIKWLIGLVYDTQLTTGIRKTGLETWEKKKADKIPKAPSTISIKTLITKLHNNELTGDLAKATALQYIRTYPKYSDLIKHALEGDLKIRMAAKTIQKAFPGLFKFTYVMLAQDFEQKRFDSNYNLVKKNLAKSDLTKTLPVCYMSQKIDGVRLLALVTIDDSKINTIEFISRFGKTFTSLSKLATDLKSNANVNKLSAEYTKGFVLDGELIARDPNGSENFKLTVSLAKKKELQMDNPLFKVFDVIPMSAFDAGVDSKDIYSQRLDILNNLLPECKYATTLEQTEYTPKLFETMKLTAESKEWEGIMLRFNSEWEPSRSYFLMKYKFFQTEEFKVEDVGIELMPFPNSTGGIDKIMALKHVLIKHKGNTVFVGSGFTASERIAYGKDPKSILGMKISVRFQEEFKDEKSGKYSLRCPTFKAVIGVERDI